LKIRSEKESDINQITGILNQAFKGTDEGKIAEDLRRNKNLTISLVCEIDGTLAGHIAYSPISNKSEEIIGIGLAPVAVLPSMHNQGIGSQLIKHGNKEVFEMGFKKIFVLGDLKYYSRFGFVLAKEYNYYCEYDPEGNHFMVLEEPLKKPGKTMIYYCKEFSV
jgi:putative acetyltransferase